MREFNWAEGDEPMKLGYTILYVSDVAASLQFFERAFGLKRRFLHESGTYGELDTGETTLSFAAHELGDSHFPGGHVHADSSAAPLGMEIALVTTDVAEAHRQAVASGARELAAPATKPWGQVVSYVRAPDGCLVEICTPVGG
jgi:catechol 2,3-dioxygenase-like lactoylglutathione lyase family enzyme